MDQANLVKISGYSKKANALIQLTIIIYDRENDPILERGQSMYQSLAATTNSRQHNVMYQSNQSLNIPRAYPGHLTSFPAREGGDLMNLVFPGAGNLITTHRGWGI